MSLDWYLHDPSEGQVFEINATHNLGKMWSFAGIWDVLYEGEPKHARDAAPLFYEALKHMTEHAADYEAMNPANGWGDFDGARKVVEKCLLACLRWPDATTEISR